MRMRAAMTSLAAIALACGGTGAAGTSGADRTVVIEMTDFAFTPRAISLKPGERVTLTLKNAGSLEHEFMAGTVATAGRGYAHDWLASAKLGPVDAAHAAGHTGEGVRVPARGTATLTIVVPPQVGEFEFGCFITGHYESGMTGRLVVDAGIAPNAVPNLRTSPPPAVQPTRAPGGATGSPRPTDEHEAEGH